MVYILPPYFVPNNTDVFEAVLLNSSYAKRNHSLIIIHSTIRLNPKYTFLNKVIYPKVIILIYNDIAHSPSEHENVEDKALT